MTQATPTNSERHRAFSRETLVHCLQDAHAMEKQSESVLSGAVSGIENYPMVEARLQQHLEETQAQIDRLEQLLDRLGESRSAMKDAAGGISALATRLMSATSADEILKNSLALYALENFEVAAYVQLVAIASEAGEEEAAAVLRQSLAEERAMACWVGGSSRMLVHRFLELSSEGGRQAAR